MKCMIWSGVFGWSKAKWRVSGKWSECGASTGIGMAGEMGVAGEGVRIGLKAVLVPQWAVEESLVR